MDLPGVGDRKFDRTLSGKRVIAEKSFTCFCIMHLVFNQIV